MPKILSRAGVSLADIYDVEGSIAGIEQLETRELPIVHEMGATVFSERFRTAIRRETTGAVLQSTAFGVKSTTLPPVPTRLLGIAILCTSPTRVEDLSVLVRQPLVSEQESPIWVYDQNVSTTIRVIDNGSLVTLAVLQPIAAYTYIPTFVGGTEQGEQGDHVSEMVLRGITTAFGAGTVTTTALYYLALAQAGGVNSKGLPIPSW